LWLTGAAGNRELDGTGTAGIPDLSFWYLAGGLRRNFFGIGDTVLFGEYSETTGGLAQTSLLVGATSATDSEVTHWGLGVNQYIDAAAMEVFLVYKHYEAEATGLVPLADFDAVIGGARVNF
jgi:hypothetical protein